MKRDPPRGSAVVPNNSHVRDAAEDIAAAHECDIVLILQLNSVPVSTDDIYILFP